MSSEASGRLDDLMRSVAAGGTHKLVPLERWNPPDCGEIDIRIDVEGVWHHAGTPIRRLGLVKLFASVMRREGERYVLVTPVEKLGIQVEDAPFLAVDMAGEGEGETLIFRTNLDEAVRCDAAHPLRFDARPDSEELRPYIYVRRGLWARLTRSVFYELVERAQEREIDGERVLGVASGGTFFPIVPAAALDGNR
ncbi:MAG TPA: DUF1285 domain-containing protein [Ancylobacter sp.]